MWRRLMARKHITSFEFVVPSFGFVVLSSEFRVLSSEFGITNYKLGTRNPKLSFLDVEIQAELQRMRTHSHRSDFLLAFVSDPTLDQLRAKHVALQQEVVVTL